MLSFEEYIRKFEDFRYDDFRTKLISKSMNHRIIYSILRIEGKINCEQILSFYMEKESGARVIALFLSFNIMEKIDEENYKYVPHTPTEEGKENAN